MLRGNGHLGEVTPNAELLALDHQAVPIAPCRIAQHHAVMRIDRPVALGLDAHIAGFGLGVQEEAVVGHDDRFLEAHAAQLVQRDADQLERAGDQAQRGLRVALQLAVDLGGAQHQQIDGLGDLRLAAHEVVERHLREAVAVALGQHIHALA